MPGKVYLIGAGPGDPGLITVRGLRCLQKADVVVYDRLVNQRLLGEAPSGAELVYVGKGPGERAMEQDEINLYLAASALEGKMVARLKGGDPFVFGRGGEEALALAQARVPFEVVPGISSAIAAPAYAGIPLTHRGIASSFTVVTGNEDPVKGSDNLKWDMLARNSGTLVVLMGWDALENITETLVKEGMSPSTPVALIRWGTEAYQRTVTGTLCNIVQESVAAGLSPPVVAVIGPVVELRRQLRWFDSGPLFGKRILVTRSRAQASALSEMLAAEGAEPLEVPTLAFLPLEVYSSLDRAISALHEYSWIIFTSANGVEALFDRMRALGRDSRAMAGVKVGAIGPATAATLERQGIRADIVPTEYVSEGIIHAMEPLDLSGTRVLLPRADVGRDELADGLARLGAQVDQVPVYHTVTPEASRGIARETLADGRVDVATFTSSSTVLNLLDLLDGDISILGRVVVACIGPITARTALERGLRVDIVAKEYTIAGLVGALKEHYAGEEVG